MADFTPLPTFNGVGSFHLNRFRVVVQPPANIATYERIAAGLFKDFPSYLNNPNTAKVESSPKLWNGHDTLKFRGVARIRPFSAPVGPGGLPIPSSIRDWVMPDLHTDSVGILGLNGRSGFTVETLKREFRDADDDKIAVAIKSVCAALGAVGIPLGNTLADYAIKINQMHFLAGRRAWRFDRARVFGYDSECWVMETAALERFSHLAFQSSQLAMGDFGTLLKEVWVTYLRQFLKHNGLTSVDLARGSEWSVASDNVLHLQVTLDTMDQVVRHDHARAIQELHVSLLP